MKLGQHRARLAASPETGPWLAMVAVYLLWGSTYAAIQVAVRQIPPLLMAGTRFLLAGLLLYLLVWLTSGRRGRARDWSLPSPRQMARSGVVGLLLLVGGNGLVSLAELRVQSGVASLVIATVPLWMALAAALLIRGQGPGWLGWSGVVVGLGGVAFLVDPWSGGHLPLLSTASLLGAAILWSLGSLYASRVDLGASVLRASAVEMVVGGTAMLLLGLVLGEGSQLQLDRAGWTVIAAFLWLVVGGSILGYSCYNLALQRLPATTVATYAYVNPLVALLLGWLVLGQGLTSEVGLAAALIIVGVVLMVSGPALARRRLGPGLTRAPDCGGG